MLLLRRAPTWSWSDFFSALNPSIVVAGLALSIVFQGVSMGFRKLRGEVVGTIWSETGHFVLILCLVLAVMWGVQYVIPKPLNRADFSQSEIQGCTIGIVSDSSDKAFVGWAGATLSILVRNTGTPSSIDSYSVNVEFPKRSVVGSILTQINLVGDNNRVVGVARTFASPSQMIDQGRTIEGVLPVQFKGITRDQLGAVGTRIAFTFRDTYGKVYTIRYEFKGDPAVILH